MFHKKKFNPNITDTLIGEGTIVEGVVISTASLFIEGKVIGEIECAGDITVGKKGILQSRVAARDIIVAGVIEGDISAKGTLIIKPSGKVDGNITVNKLIINEGGIFLGISFMKSSPVELIGLAVDNENDHAKTAV